ncbi:hypothetical protein [Actinomadura sp. HBU206391]|uniref:hypothetical protein n=1 Tax=Actinomadura sp. HBU206391 TaxID=2731692 RepID=UPI00164F1117|nr:hypothetical protein [Actinomadura sp. HBU206391]MBC6456366.1 hypothetical protein [Actinomadura sp. HBU206391]
MNHTEATLSASTKLNWGDVPTWAGVTAAVAAGIVGFFLFRIESRRDARAEHDRQLAAEDRHAAAEDRRRAEEDRRAEIEDARRAQADKVAAWFGSFEEPNRPRPRTPEYLTDRYGAYIRNASDLPIYDVRVEFYYVQDRTDGTSGWDPIHRGSSVEELRAIPPQGTEFVDMPQGIRRQVDDISDEMYVTGIEFRDSAGNRWARDPRGQLQEL